MSNLWKLQSLCPLSTAEVGYFYEYHMFLYKHSTKIKKLCRFKFHVIAEDMTGQVQVVLGDREARTVVGRRCFDIADEVFKSSYILLFSLL